MDGVALATDKDPSEELMTVHHFQPSHYYSAIGTAEPVLRIKPGDTVHTTCVDAAGQDSALQKVTPGGNPMTGPFYVEGARPGDTLVVHLEAITPNRRYGWSASFLAPNVVDPISVRDLPWPPKDAPRVLGEWDLDLAAGTATLTAPETALGRLVLPIRPMLGCFGVAADEGQAISTATSAEHGGNMDYRGFTEGVTVYFPVFAEGALFYLGDPHALQGAGEIIGTGIEVSCDATFRVDVRRDWKTRWPRGENDIEIFTAGNARPLDQALQHATTEMVHWLEEAYGLDPAGAQTLMGMVVDYEVGNVFDPAYTMICKMPKAVLANFKSKG
jgi:acetamidase/formamidase